MPAGVRINQKLTFFDSKKVKSAVDKATVRVLSRFGFLVRRDAKRSIRTRRDASKRGMPPTNKTGLLKNFIFFVFDDKSNSVVIGPAKLSGVKGRDVPKSLEYGGPSRSADGSLLNVGPRPFMNPALDRNLPQLPQMWRDSVRA
jgi:hypothetical protein